MCVVFIENFIRNHTPLTLSFVFSSDSTVAKAGAQHIRVHYKHCREISQAIKGRTVAKAKEYLQNVLEYKDGVPFTKYTGGIGRHSVAKKYKVCGDKIAWPQKATKVYLGLLTNIEANAEAKGLDLEKCTITHTQANQAPKMRRRTYRAHGRVNKYESSPAHIQIIAEETADEVKKEVETAAPKLSKKQAAQAAAKAKRVKVGE